MKQAVDHVAVEFLCGIKAMLFCIEKSGFRTEEGLSEDMGGDRFLRRVDRKRDAVSGGGVIK
jgi:hypothetical protein